jgi:hypothetical protein
MTLSQPLLQLKQTSTQGCRVQAERQVEFDVGRRLMWTCERDGGSARHRRNGGDVGALVGASVSGA